MKFFKVLRGFLPAEERNLNNYRTELENSLSQVRLEEFRMMAQDRL